MLRLPPLAIAALAAAAGLPAAAQAATWTQPLAPCYVSVGAEPIQREVVPIQASGFTANAAVNLLVDGVPVDVTNDGAADPVIYADPAGVVSGSIRAPYQAQGQRPFTISLTDQRNTANALTATPQVSALALTLRPASAPPSSRVRFRGRGFTAGAGVWAHYIYRGKVRKSVRLVRRASGSCGTFTAKRRQIPVTRPRTGTWTLQVDQQKRWEAHPNSVFVRLEIKVERVIRSG